MVERESGIEEEEESKKNQAKGKRKPLTCRREAHRGLC